MLSHCDNNQLTSLKGIESLENLTELGCYNNPLPHEPNLKAFKEWFITENRERKLELMKDLIIS